jgi:hypothetical protein
MRFLAYPFLLIAGAGFLLSLTAHVLALFGVTVPGGGLVWTLHAGIFLVWIPAIFIAGPRLKSVPRKDQMNAMLGECPLWMRRAVKIIFAYAILNFFLFLASTMGNPKPTGAAPPAVIRGFSGHWMIFYAAAFVAFYSKVRRSENKSSTERTEL